MTGLRPDVVTSLFGSIAASPDRVLLIGPVFPYRVGIAQHTTMLHRALRAQADCLTISFSRQYPRLLFPGKSDKDENLAGYIEGGAEYLIDSVNPLSWANAVKRAREFNPRVVVFPWWHVYWVPCFAWMSNKLRKAGIEVVFLCHNAVDHEDVWWKRVAADFVLSNAHRFVVHTLTDKENLLKRFPDRTVEIHPLPIFDHFPQPTQELPRRATLELLFFGFVRPYKGLDVLLEAMTLLKNEDVFLSIVGEFWNGENEIRKYLVDYGITDRVEVVARYVSDVDAAAYFFRSDVVVLPYHSATGSAVIPLAYHYGKPVIATRVGGLSDVVEDGATGTLIDSGSSAQLIDAIKQALSGAGFSSAEGIKKIKAWLSWHGLASAVVGSALNNQTAHPSSVQAPIAFCSMKSAARFHMRKWFMSGFTLLAIVFFVAYAARNIDSIPPLHWNSTSILVALFSVVLVVFSIGVVGSIWHMLLRDNRVALSWKQVQIIFSIAQFGKYLPGNVGQHVGRVFMAREIGIPLTITISTMLIEVIWVVAVAGGLGVCSLVFYTDGKMLKTPLQFGLGPVSFGLGILLLLASPWLGINFMNKFLPHLATRLSGGKAIAAPRLGTAVMMTAMFLLCFLLTGMIIKLQAMWFFGVTDGGLFELTCLFSVIWLSGYLVPGVPGGLGVREAMMVLLLSPVLGPGVAVGLGVTLRGTTTVGDAVAFFLGLVARKIQKARI